jgi:hypothetical protein
MPDALGHGLGDDILTPLLDDLIDPSPCVIEIGTHRTALLR